MNSRMLMSASAAVMAAVGLVLSFAPQEALTYFHQPASNGLTLVLQLTGALYLGFAFMNWTARGAVIGGIYGRAILLGNFLHFTMGFLALLKVSASGPDVSVWAATGVYALFAGWGGRLLFFPVREANRGGSGPSARDH